MQRCTRVLWGVVALGAAAWAQKIAPAPLSAEQIFEKNIAASGGREALGKWPAMQFRGEFEVPGMGSKIVVDSYGKAPDKRLTVVRIEGFGAVRTGFDGQTAWAEDPQQGLRILQGEALDRVRRDSIYNPELRWREVFREVQLLPKGKVGDRETYVIRFSLKWGQPITRYYDAENFMVLRQDADVDSGQGVVTAQNYMSDYRDVEGVKFPFAIRQTTPAGEITIKITEVKFAATMEDAPFAPPAKKP